MTATITPQTASFKALCADLYGDERTPAVPATPPVFPTDPLRTAYRAAVAEVALNAKAALPDSAGRIDSAVKLVLAGDVELLPDGTAKIASQSHGTTAYFTVNGVCECKDFAHAPGGWCKHRTAMAISKRASAMLDTAEHTPDTHNTMVSADPPPADTALLAPYIVHIHGRPFIQYSGLLALAHSRGLQRLEAHFVSVTPELAVAEATATFADGRVFSEASDSTPANVGTQVKAHFPRLALTRAKARTLRDALNVGMCSVEELE